MPTSILLTATRKCKGIIVSRPKQRNSPSTNPPAIARTSAPLPSRYHRSPSPNTTPSIESMCNVINPLSSRMRQYLRPSTLVPNRKQRTTVTALMLAVLQPRPNIRNAAQAEAEAEERSNTTTAILAPFYSQSINVEQTYCVVPPETNSVFVSSRTPQTGQSTGAGPCCRFASGVAIW